MSGVIYLYGIIITWRENSTNPSQEDRGANVSAMEGQIPIIVVIVLPGTQVSQGASTLYFSNQSYIVHSSGHFCSGKTFLLDRLSSLNILTSPPSPPSKYGSKILWALQVRIVKFKTRLGLARILVHPLFCGIYLWFYSSEDIMPYESQVLPLSVILHNCDLDFQKLELPKH